MRQLERARILRRSDDQPTLPARVKRILRKYGATMLLPGPSGILQYGFQPGNYRESTGQNLAAADQQVGLVVDASQDPGPELMTNGDFAAGLTAWTVYANGGTAEVAGGIATVTSGGTNGRIEQAKTLVANKTYIATAYVTLGSAPNMQLECIRGAAGSYASLGKFVATTPGRQLARFIFVATGADVIIQAKSANGAGTFIIEKVSLRELPGIHASQSTSGYQPYIRAVPKTVGPDRTIYAHPTWAAAGGSYTKSAPAWGGVGGSGLVVGKAYRMSFTVASITAGSSLGVYRRNAANSDNELVATINVVAGGSYSVAVPVVTDAATYDLWVDNNTFAGTLTNFSVCEVLEWTYAWQFDATDDRLVATAVPFQPADDYFAVFGVVRNGDAVLRRIWEVQNVGVGGGMGVWLTNNTATFYASGATAVTVGVADGPAVITAKKVGNARSIQADNYTPAINTAAVTNHTSLTCVIGNSLAGDRPYSGPFYGGFLGKGAISDADLQTLKQFIARLQGRNL